METPRCGQCKSTITQGSVTDKHYKQELHVSCFAKRRALELRNGHYEWFHGNNLVEGLTMEEKVLVGADI